MKILEKIVKKMQGNSKPLIRYQKNKKSRWNSKYKHLTVRNLILMEQCGPDNWLVHIHR